MEPTKVKVNDLFERAMTRRWVEFVEAYETNPDIREARFTNSGDTALHIAVSYEEIHVVVKLVESLGQNARNVLEIKNDKGNTVLHLAATLGNVDICHCIASKHRNLIASRNKEDETPLFLAAHHGKKEAFLCLNFFSEEKEAFYKKSNGDTILHAAISGESFSLAFQIIQYYPDLVNIVDGKGRTPLHILASKPNAFQSSSRLRPFDRIIYHCMFVDKLKKEEYDPKAHSNNSGSKTSLNFPPNYEACMAFFRIIECWIRLFSELILTQQILVARQKCCYRCDRVAFSFYLFSLAKPQGKTKDIEENTPQQKSSTSDAENRTLGKGKAQQSCREETPLLIAAKMGVAEMVEKILDKFPVAVQDTNSENKNIVLLAVENRQTGIYQILMNRKILGDSVFRQLDNQGNSALHLAATFGEYRPWLIPGAALQMQWEIKWYRFVKKSMPPHFFVRCNDNDETPKDIFTNTHKELIKEGREWLTKTSESCSVVAALIATVAYATSATVPGGVNQESGTPVFEDKIQFKIFAISSLIALCFSVTALVFFLAILTSRYEENDFAMDLPKKLLLGLTSLFTSIASILISFCSGHFFILKDDLRTAAYPIYAVTCLPMTFFAIIQLPLYFDLIWAIFKKVPQRSYKKTSL
ncbi:hypothetical protein LWI28_006980 [Acer negundo]|uniref:PGG domain-containing protein n=1 Tax=Acer negundo TaxID=4023 RepID=A0AAD5JCE5_ACENE|nr:hypothetical protein LWI28_006980 [Acer negundo]